MDKTVLFITRKYPPITGGMEKMAYELYSILQKYDINIILLAWKMSNRWLFAALPLLFIRAVANLLFRDINIIYIQDGLLAPLGFLLKKIFKKPCLITIHGLDITFPNIIYQSIIPFFVKRFDQIVCVSEATRKECLKRGIPGEKISVIPNGIPDNLFIEEERENIRDRLSFSLPYPIYEKKILLSVGRMIQRKGFDWFIENVISDLWEQRKDFLYIIIGRGQRKDIIKKLIIKKGLNECVYVKDQINDDGLRLIINAAHIFIVPNIPVTGDIEGFGIVALEAASCGVPVIASDLEGLKDAVRNGENGLFVNPMDKEGYVKQINILLNDEPYRRKFGEKARKYTIENYNWNKMGGKYFELLFP